MITKQPSSFDLSSILTSSCIGEYCRHANVSSIIHVTYFDFCIRIVLVTEQKWKLIQKGNGYRLFNLNKISYIHVESLEHKWRFQVSEIQFTQNQHTMIWQPSHGLKVAINIFFLKIRKLGHREICFP